MIAAVLAGAAVVSFLLLGWLVRALPPDFLAAGINARSNHTAPARQIGGLGAAPAAIAAILAAVLAGAPEPRILLSAAGGAGLLLVVGFLDDRRGLSVGMRLAAQAAAAILLVWSLDPAARFLGGMVPFVLERGLLVVGLVWFVNMTNFMDGLDLMVVAGVGVPHALLAVAAGLALLDPAAGILCAAAAGGLLGFAPFNRHPARVFLGDGGSLSIGLLTGAAVLLLARQHPAAALLPFLYFLADSVSTILMRLARRENVLAAHSSHAYQLARRAGRPVPSIAAEVALLGVVTTGLALAAIAAGTDTAGAAALAAGLGLCGLSVARMRRFRAGR